MFNLIKRYLVWSFDTSYRTGSEAQPGPLFLFLFVTGPLTIMSLIGSGITAHHYWTFNERAAAFANETGVFYGYYVQARCSKGRLSTPFYDVGMVTKVYPDGFMVNWEAGGKGFVKESDIARVLSYKDAQQEIVNNERKRGVYLGSHEVVKQHCDYIHSADQKIHKDVGGRFNNAIIPVMPWYGTDEVGITYFSLGCSTRTIHETIQLVRD